MYTREEIEAAGLDDFRVFLRQVWDHLGLPKPTPVQNDIAYALQHGDRRQIIQAFRGVGKSWITVAFVLWNLFLDPQKKILVVSASQELANDFSKFCQQLIHGMPLLHHLRPRPGQRASGISFDVGPARESKDPSVKSAGITGQITGTRADLIVSDDIEVPKNSYTHLLRERLAELVKEFDAILKPDGRIVYLGTPQAEATLYNRLRRRGYKITVWPAEIPASLDRYGGTLANFVVRRIERGAKPGDPLDPLRFDRTDLMERRLSYGESGYALQFMLDTTPAEAEKHPLKLRDLIVHDCDADMAHVKLVWGGEPSLVIQDLQAGGFDGDVYVRPAWKSDEMTKYTGTVMFIDPSGMGEDETAYAIVRYAHGLLYLVAVGGFLDGFGEATLEALAGKAVRYKVNNVVIEQNYGGGMFAQLLKPVLIRAGYGGGSPDQGSKFQGGPGGRIEEVWHSGQKERRILDTLAPIVRNHRLVVDRRVIEEDLKQQADKERYSFVQQFTRMSATKGALPNEDRLEAVAGACAYWVERMDRDKDRALEAHKAELLEKELRRFKEHAVSLGRRPSGPLRVIRSRN